MNDHDPTAASEPGSRTPFTQILGRVVLGVLVVLFVVFASANAQFVDFSWVVGETDVTRDAAGERVEGGVRLIVLLIVTLIVGMLIGALLTWQGVRSRRRAGTQDED